MCQLVVVAMTLALCLLSPEGTVPRAVPFLKGLGGAGLPWLLLGALPGFKETQDARGEEAGASLTAARVRATCGPHLVVPRAGCLPWFSPLPPLLRAALLYQPHYSQRSRCPNNSIKVWPRVT